MLGGSTETEDLHSASSFLFGAEFGADWIAFILYGIVDIDSHGWNNREFVRVSYD